MRIGMFRIEGPCGGTCYEDMVMAALSKKCTVKMYSLVVQKKYLLKMTRIRQLYRLSKIKANNDMWIRTFVPVVSLSFDKTKGLNIALFHHIDNKVHPHYALSLILEKFYYRNLKRVDAIVCVSQFWKNYLENQGYKNIHIIYNGFDLKNFKFDEKECQEFKEKFNLVQKPIVYIGNCQIRKGVVEVYKSLKNMNIDLVTSGPKEVELPCRNLNLTYRNYLLLLKVSSVVIVMSQFKEGWCRTAHEAMLCKTPVIGSGKGGMAELLEGGSQIICDDFSKLPRLLVKVMNDSEQIGKKGYMFASQFTFERFENEWLNLVGKLLK